jgi:hypothetical protein
MRDFSERDVNVGGRITPVTVEMTKMRMGMGF